MKSTATSTTDASIENYVSISKTIVGGIIATVAMTILLGLFGKNWIKDIGSLLLSDEQNALATYTIGILINFGIGIGYAFAYVKWILPIRDFNYILKGVVYGTALMVIAYAGFPYLAAVLNVRDLQTNPAVNIAAQQSTTEETISANEVTPDATQLKKDEPAATEEESITPPKESAGTSQPTEEVTRQNIVDLEASIDKTLAETNDTPQQNSSEPKTETQVVPESNTPSASESETKPQEQSQTSQTTPVVGASLFPKINETPIISGVDVGRDITGSWIAHIVYGVALAIFFQRRKLR